ncbi:MAG: Gfo/Idh/MocA family oxidoreductase, partial [Planctomycetales bacterium]|nr:Gfo/Idh/MocA family oxidoreductase [Planctomycetales bacterium]
MIRFGVIGLGYWGPNLVRCFNELENGRVTLVCDRDISRLNAITTRFPGIKPTESVEDVWSSDAIDAVVIATPTSTHYELAKRAIECGLHVFVEKPLAQTVEQCEDLIALATANGTQLFVGHVFLHSAPVIKLKELVDSGELGDVCYVSSSRLNLGPIRKDVDVLWDLAPHDISIMLHLLGQAPQRVSCSGLAHLNRRLCDVCNLTLHFADNRVGLIHVSWLDPLKRRVMTIVGSKQMAVYDDLGQEKIKIYDKGVETPKEPTNFGEFQFSYRYGGSYSPWLKEFEPLKAECSAFADCIETGATPTTDGRNGAEVVAVLQAEKNTLY